MPASGGRELGWVPGAAGVMLPHNVSGGGQSVSFVARALGMSRNTVIAGLKDVGAARADLPVSRIRGKGGAFHPTCPS
jgi:hypothetical protein